VESLAASGSVVPGGTSRSPSGRKIKPPLIPLTGDFAETVVVAPARGRLGTDWVPAAAGVKLTESGAPVLNRFLQTSNRSIYAAGDAADG